LRREEEGGGRQERALELFLTIHKVHRLYDLKGSTVGRITEEKDRKEGVPLKDLDFNEVVFLSPVCHLFFFSATHVPKRIFRRHVLTTKKRKFLFTRSRGKKFSKKIHFSVFPCPRAHFFFRISEAGSTLRYAGTLYFCPATT
jgi:hypothetical protein